MGVFDEEKHQDLASQGGDAGGQAAIAELIKEATLLSSMRHPNVVWVYGIVLKPMNPKDGDSDDDEHDGGKVIVLAQQHLGWWLWQHTRLLRCLSFQEQWCHTAVGFVHASLCLGHITAYL